jgi:hypothetical protein
MGVVEVRLDEPNNPQPRVPQRHDRSRTRVVRVGLVATRIIDTNDKHVEPPPKTSPMRNATAGNPEEGRMLVPVSSHAVTEIRWEPVRSKANRERWQGILDRDRPPDPETLRKDPPRLHHILIQGNLCQVDSARNLGRALHVESA